MLTPSPKRILVMRYRFIGDTLLTIPFLKALRQAYPEAQIDVLVAPQSGEVLTHCPDINTLIYYDPKILSFWGLVTHLRKNSYDTAFILKRSFSSAMIAFLSGIPRRIGFDTECRGFLITHRVPYQPNQPEADCFLDVLRAIGIECPPIRDWERPLMAWWSTDDNDMAEAMFDRYQGKRNVVLHLTSTNTAKQWPIGEATALAEWLILEKNVTIHCLGSPSDTQTYEALRRHLPQAARGQLENWCGQTNLLESLAFLAKMDLVIGVDSGTLHMASSVNVPIIALFGPMNEVQWGPLGKGHTVVTEPMACRPCNLKVSCEYEFKCMKTLSWQKVQAVCETHWPH